MLENNGSLSKFIRGSENKLYLKISLAGSILVA